MLEKAARALYAEYENRPIYAQGQMNGMLAEELTRAVLQALREPDEGMLDVGDSSTGLLEGTEGPKFVWQAMIDHILNHTN